ncbi:MAG: hypothetical protein D6683_10850 [Actinomyces sp.]|nr:MAG: hypothetical protein D6683_10850 [Actinomyces sp.]
MATASAVALNVSVIQATSASSSASDAGTEPTTVVVEVPAGSDELGLAPVAVAGIEASVPDTAASAPAAAPGAAPASVAAAPATSEPSTTAPATTEPSTTAPATTEPSTTAPATTEPSTTAPATTSPAATEYLTFTAGPAGEVVVADHGGSSLEFWTAYPANGWHYKVEKPQGKSVEVKYFKEGAGEGKLIVELRNGSVRTKTEGFGGAGGGEDDD